MENILVEEITGYEYQLIFGIKMEHEYFQGMFVQNKEAPACSSQGTPWRHLHADLARAL